MPPIWQLVKVATPATAAMVGKPGFEHDSDAPAGPEAIARVTVPVSEVTTLPLASSTETFGEVVKSVASPHVADRLGGENELAGRRRR